MKRRSGGNQDRSTDRNWEMDALKSSFPICKKMRIQGFMYLLKSYILALKNATGVRKRRSREKSTKQVSGWPLRFLHGRAKDGW
jgi:hypothetical protein